MAANCQTQTLALYISRPRGPREPRFSLGQWAGPWASSWYVVLPQKSDVLQSGSTPTAPIERGVNSPSLKTAALQDQCSPRYSSSNFPTSKPRWLKGSESLNLSPILGLFGLEDVAVSQFSISLISGSTGPTVVLEASRVFSPGCPSSPLLGSKVSAPGRVPRGLRLSVSADQQSSWAKFLYDFPQLFQVWPQWLVRLKVEGDRRDFPRASSDPHHNNIVVGEFRAQCDVEFAIESHDRRLHCPTSYCCALVDSRPTVLLQAPDSSHVGFLDQRERQFAFAGLHHEFRRRQLFPLEVNLYHCISSGGVACPYAVGNHLSNMLL
ncbi:hypothetical protein ACJJTC_003961 [Scirpophaga incertulas]